MRYAVRDPRVGDLLDVARAVFNAQLTGSHTMLKALRLEARQAPRRRAARSS